MKKLLSIITAGLLLTTVTRAQEVGVLVDTLVDKNLLTPQEAERIRAGLAKENAQTSAGKLKLSNSITELSISGDGRLRYQYDQADAQLDTPATAGTAARIGANPNLSQRSRWRFRLRLNADVKFGDAFFGGFGLATGQAADSNMETFTSGFDNYNIFINKAFLGWKPTDWLTIIGGKEANPFYTTELVWDADINPQGFVEILDVGKALFPDSKFSLQLIAGQFIFSDNNEFGVDSDLSTDAWLFAQQVKASYKFDSNTSATFAPGFMTYTAADLTGLRNTRAFTDAVFPAAAFTAVQTTTTDQRQNAIQIQYDATGRPTVTVTPIDKQTTVQVTTPATGSPRTVTTTGERAQKGYRAAFNAVTGDVAADPAHGIPAVAKDVTKANQVVTSTKIVSTGTTVITNAPPANAVSGETRSQTILTAPGDFSFRLFGLKSKLYWDIAYNLNGAERYNQIYGLSKSPGGGHSGRDSLAWLAGLQVGENKKAGDWSLYANYREIGIASVDPNLNDSDFALSALNVRGFKVSAAYNFTDWLSAAVSYARAWNLKDNLIGGQATGGSGIADINTVDVFQVDLNWKF